MEKKQVPSALVEKTLVNLRVLSTLRENEKLTVNSSGNFVPETVSFFNSFFRFMNKLDRWENLYKIQDLVAAAEVLQSNEDEHNQERIQKALESCTNGLRNMQLTYKHDVLFFQSVEVLIERIDGRSSMLEKF